MSMGSMIKSSDPAHPFREKSLRIGYSDTEVGTPSDISILGIVGHFPGKGGKIYRIRQIERLAGASKRILFLHPDLQEAIK